MQNTTGWMISIREERGEFYYSNQVDNRPTAVSWANGTATSFVYDARGNVIETRFSPVPDSGFLTSSEFGTYALTCENPIICNKPQALKDRNGNTTTFEYSAIHGGVTKSTGPGANGVDRETRYV
jgi:YD repeat-containing protein